VTSVGAAARTVPEVPAGHAATEPPEARGLRRDGTRLLVVSPDGLEQARFRDIGRYLQPGDLVVVNTSATLPAAVAGVRAGDRPVIVHFSSPLDDGTWTLELRTPDASGPLLDGVAGETIVLAGGARLQIASPYAGPEGRSRLLRARLAPAQSVEGYLERFGRPIAYSYVRGRWPLPMYQTVFAREPGSAEMPSAGRPFTESLVTTMVAEGVTFAPLVLHTAVSSLEGHETPPPERVHVPPATAALVAHTRGNGGLVVAVGTTVTRALETAAGDDDTVASVRGWTDLVLGPDRPARVVDALVTGWHAPEASHLLLLEAVAGRDSVERAYESALRHGYLWHEFGDSCLFLPRRAHASRVRAAR